MKVHYCVYKGLPLVPILPVCIFPPCFPKIQSNLILFHPCQGLLHDFFLSDFLTKILYAFLVSPTFVTCPTHLIVLDLITLIILGEVYVS